MTRRCRRLTFATLTSVAALIPAVSSAAHVTGFVGSGGRAQVRTVLRFAAVSGVHGANHFVLRRAGANLQLIDTDTGKVLRNAAFARTSGVLITGAGGDVNNTLTLDFSGGSLAVPEGVAYRGGRGGYNVLALRGGHFAHEREVARGPHAGLIVLGHTTVRYSQIAPVNDTAPAATDTISGTAAAETINVVNGPVIGALQTTQVSSSTGTFELQNVANKTSVTINGNGGGDTFNLNTTTAATGLSSLAVDATQASVSSTFNIVAIPVAVSLVGGGTDTANIGTGSAESITSPVTIGDPHGIIAVNVNNATGASSRFVTLSSSGGADTISGMTGSTITCVTGDLASLSLNGGSAGNTFIVSGTGNFLPVTLNTGTGVDSTFVQNVAASSSVAIHGQNGSDGIAVSDAGSVQGVLGAVSISNKLSFTSVVIDDSNDTTARTASIGTDGTTDTISGIAPGTITAKASDLDDFTLDGGSAGNNITLAGLALGVSSATATLNTGTGADTTNVQSTSSLGPGPLNINGQSGNDAVNLGSGGSVQNLTGPVSVTNGGATTLTVNDASDTTARAVTVGTAAVTGLAPAQINYAGVPGLTIDGGAPSDTFAVTPSSTTTDTIVGGGPVSSSPPGNTLNMTLTGATAPGLSGTSSAAGAQGTWTFGNRQPVNFTHMQSLNPTALSVGDAGTTVGGGGGAPLSFPATLLAPSALPVSASYATADGSATAGSGAYTPASGAVSFPAGTTTQAIPVTALGQATVRPPRTLTLTLADPVNAVLARAVATGTITDSFVAAPPPPAAPVLTHLTQTHTRWRVGAALAVISREARRRPPVGTSFSFGLSESAVVTLAFSQRVPGRKTHGRCVVQSKQNRNSRACSRVVPRGTLRMTGHAGTDRISFQGRLSPAGRLKPGRYTLVVGAMNAAGQSSPSGTLTFTIVK